MRYHVMRIPQYLSGRSEIGADDAYPLLTYDDAEDARRALDVLVSFTTRPPGPMQAAAAPYHFLKEADDHS